MPPHDIYRHSFHCSFTQITISCTSDAVTASRLGVVANITGYEGVSKTNENKNGGELFGHMHIVDAMLAVFDVSGGSLISTRCMHTSPRPSPHGRPAPACTKQHLTSEHV